MKPKIKSIETKYMRERETLFASLKNMDRRSFLRVSAAFAGVTLAKGSISWCSTAWWSATSGPGAP